MNKNQSKKCMNHKLNLQQNFQNKTLNKSKIFFLKKKIEIILMSFIHFCTDTIFFLDKINALTVKFECDVHIVQNEKQN